MIFTVVGKPGGGKSFYSLRHIVNVLANTENSVVTNLSINVAELHAYLAKKYPAKDIDTPRRVRLLNVEQSRRFWLHRMDRGGMDVNLEGVTREDEKQGRHVDYSIITDGNRRALAAGNPREYPGIDYVIDECHVFFDSRAWTETGLSLTYYNSQHRKLDDNVTFVTQFLELIDKRVKSFSQEFIYLRNNGAEKFLTLFRGPSYFTAKHYQRPPTGLQDLASEVHRFTLDIPLANCYDTSAGVGISGVGRPEAKRKKGFNMFWLLVPFFGFLAFLFYAPDFLASQLLGTKAGSYTAKALGVTEEVKKTPSEAVPAPANPMTPPPAAMLSGKEEDPPYPTGFVIMGRKVTVQMSDGTTRTERDDEMTRIERNSVTISGQKMFIRAKVKQTVAMTDGATMTVQPTENVTPAKQETRPPPPAPRRSSWVMHSDGVERLTPEAKQSASSLRLGE